MERHFPANPFARYADDGVVHCRSEAQARLLKARLDERFGACGLELHPGKTRVVCCNVNKPLGDGVHKSFDFLGYCFRPRLVRRRDGRLFVGFTPAISAASPKRVRAAVCKWQLHRRTPVNLVDLAQWLNPVIRGWMQYYGAYNRSGLIPLVRHIDWHLQKWVKWKYRNRGRSWRRARSWLGQVARNQPELFAHWRLTRPYAAQ